jgi:hypothetical protein
MKWITEVAVGPYVGVVDLVCTCGHTFSAIAYEDVQCAYCETACPWPVVWAYYEHKGPVEVYDDLVLQIPPGIRKELRGRFKVRAMRGVVSLSIVTKPGSETKVSRMCIIEKQGIGTIWSPRRSPDLLSRVERESITGGELREWAPEPPENSPETWTDYQ